MLDVHHKGRAVVSSGTREKAELDVFRLHEHGLWATMRQDGHVRTPASSHRAAPGSLRRASSARKRQLIPPAAGSCGTCSKRLPGSAAG